MAEQIAEKDELLLNALLDGELSADRQRALRERMRVEPALQEAYDTFRRLNGLLSDRGRDRPDIDWPGFHDSIVEAVKAEPVPAGTIRSAAWIRIGVPLAAAAAVVLLVGVFMRPFNRLPDKKEWPEKSVLVDTSEKDDIGKLMISYNRPNVPRTAKGDSIKINFGRSAEVAQKVHQHDEWYRARPTWMSRTVNTITPIPADDFPEGPPI